MQSRTRPTTSSNFIMSKFQVETGSIARARSRPSTTSSKSFFRKQNGQNAVHRISKFGFQGNMSKSQPSFRQLQNALPVSFKTPVIEQRYRPKHRVIVKGNFAQRRTLRKDRYDAHRSAKNHEFLQQTLRRRLGVSHS